ncbi:MAG: chitobiase/beta-hexosaminidase C-terminal domain-containing protein [Bacteroidales bacterium]|nr:chitobiase/beta-hexosaminidase C-terminal domain-containing protein [Bacteroidales bacterium]
MKRFIIILLMAVTLTAAAQEQVNLGLIPTPQKVVMGTGIADRNKVKLNEERVDTLPVEANLDQAYQIIIEKKKITIRYVGEQGLVNALCTMTQLGRIYDNKFPCCTITDWPAYKYRGWMDDISRGPVPHEKYRQKQWKVLHALKYNFCNYYTEHTLYQKEFPDLAPAYAADCKPHPDEVINLQLFAHAEKTLRVPFYQHLMDSRSNFDPGNEATYEFLRERIAGAFERISNLPFFIINCDETEQLGTGRAKRLVDSLGADQVYINHINRCYDIINHLYWSDWEGIDADDTVAISAPRVVMWGDIVAKNPAMMKQLPKDMTYIMWAYEPLDSYDHLIKPFKDNGTPFWVAPSLSHSSNMIPNPYRYMKNIANLARDGYLNGAEGLMNTCWDDNGEALFDNCWHGLYWSAEMAWNPIKTDDPEEFARREKQFNENFERLYYGTENGERKTENGERRTENSIRLTSQMYDVGALESNPFIGDWYTSAALLEPLLNFNPDNTSDAMAGRAIEVLELIAGMAVDSVANPHAHYALHRIKATAQKTLLRYVVYHGKVKYELFAENYYQTLTNLKREYLRLWDQENGEYERYIVCNRYDDLAREVLELDRHVFIETENGERRTENDFPMVSLRTLYGDKDIYYTLDGSEPTMASTKYEGPFPLERSATIKTICYNEYGEGIITEQYLLSHLGMGAKITLNTPFATYKSIYSGGGENALIDGLLGSNTTYADGHWQGYWGDSIDVVIDFGTPREIHEINMRFMQNTFDWILAPKEIFLYVSDDGQQWRPAGSQFFDMDPRETGMRLKHYSVEATVATFVRNKGVMESNPTARYLRVVVPNPGPLPSWHPAPGQPSYLFTDEIIVK